MTTDPHELIRRWGLPAARSARRATSGTNNTVWLLEAGADRYVLRIYQNSRPSQVEAEHRLLIALDEVGLPFRVPVPIRTPDGDTAIETSAGPAALFRYLPGVEATRTDARHLALVGQALGELDAALAQLPAALAPTDWRRPLAEIHPAVPDIDDLIAELDRACPGHPGVRWLAASAPTAVAAYQRFCDTLPLQLVHGDFALSNVLLTDGAVSAVLDFDIAGIDLRVNDLTAGLVQCAADWWRPGGLAQWATFLQGYLDRLPLLPEELHAIPELLRRRDLGNVIWRAARWRRGQSTLQEVVQRLDDAVLRDDWLTNRAPLLADLFSADYRYAPTLG